MNSPYWHIILMVFSNACEMTTCTGREDTVLVLRGWRSSCNVITWLLALTSIDSELASGKHLTTIYVFEKITAQSTTCNERPISLRRFLGCRVPIFFFRKKK